MKRLLLALLLALPAFAQTNPVTAAYPGAVVTDDQLTYQDDFGSTTLSASVGASDLTIFITSAVGFVEPTVIAVCPVGECSSGNYANAELMLVTGISGTTLTIAASGRSLGQDCIGSTTGETFANGSVVELVPSACSHNRLAAEIKAIETALGANLANVSSATEFDTEAELETLLTDVTNLIVSTEIDSVAELEALAGAVNLIASTEVDTIAELETLLGAVNVLLETEIDAGSELAALLDDETGTGVPVFNIAPNLRGVITGTGTAVDDDDCTGQQGQYWYDSTDGQFEFCNANAGVPSVPGTAGAGGGAPTDATYLTNSFNATLTNEVPINNEATLEAVVGAVNLIVSTEIDTQAEAEALLNADFEADNLSNNAASDLPFVPAGTIEATDVQAAIEEVAAEGGGGGGTSINVEEDNVEEIPAVSLTGIDFLGADFDVDADGNEANVLIAAAIARDAEVTSAVSTAVTTAVSGTANFLAYFDDTNSVISSNIGADANTITFPVTTGRVIFGGGGTYIYELSDGIFRFGVGAADRLGMDAETLSSVAAFGGQVRYSGGGSVSAAVFGFSTDPDNGLYYIGTNNFGMTAGGSKIIDYSLAQVSYSTTLGFFSAAAPTTDAAGETAFDNNAWAASRGAAQIFDGTANTNVVATLASDVPTNQQIPTWNTGGTITWETPSGGGSDFLGSFATPSERTLDAAGSATFTAIAQTIDTFADAATDDWTGAICAAGISWSVRPASDARSVVIISSSVPTPTGTDLTMDQDGDMALVICQTADTPEVILFVDEDGQTYFTPIDGGQSLTGTTTRPAGTTRIQLSRHADNCQALTDGLDGEICRQENTDVRYTCETIDALCDTAGEWVADAGGGGGAETNSLETLTTGIATTEIPIGTAVNTVVFAALSGDVTMTNAGVVTIGADAVAAAEIITDGVSADELNATGVETELEAVLDLNQLQGAVTDAQVPDTITVDLAAVATSANAGDSATAFFATGTIDEARLDANTVLDNKLNTFGAFGQDFSQSTSLKVPVSTIAAPTLDGMVAFDSQTFTLEYGDNNVNRVIANLDEAQTLSSKTLTDPTISATGFTNANHAHAAANSGGQIAVSALTGTAAISQGGTGQTTQTAAMDALSPTTTKGDLLVDNGTSVIRVAVGATNDHVLTVDSAQASGVKWAAAAGGGTCVVDSGLKPSAAANDTSGAGSMWTDENAAVLGAEAGVGTPQIMVSTSMAPGVTPGIGHFLEACYTTNANLTIYFAMKETGTITGAGTLNTTYRCVANGEAIDGTSADTGADITVDFTATTASNLYIVSQTFTPTTCAAGEMLIVHGALVAGTLNGNPNLIGMRVTN